MVVTVDQELSERLSQAGFSLQLYSPAREKEQQEAETPYWSDDRILRYVVRVIFSASRPADL